MTNTLNRKQTTRFSYSRDTRRVNARVQTFVTAVPSLRLSNSRLKFSAYLSRDYTHITLSTSTKHEEKWRYFLTLYTLLMESRWFSFTNEVNRRNKRYFATLSLNVSSIEWMKFNNSSWYISVLIIRISARYTSST